MTGWEMDFIIHYCKFSYKFGYRYIFKNVAIVLGTDVFSCFCVLSMHGYLFNQCCFCCSLYNE